MELCIQFLKSPQFTPMENLPKGISLVCYRGHQTHVFKVKYGFKKGGRFLEDLSDTDIKDLYSYTSTSLSLDKINKFTEARIN